MGKLNRRVLLGFALFAMASLARAETLTLDTPETAAICGYRALWNTPILAAPDGVRVVTDSEIKDRGGVAPFAVDLRAQATGLAVVGCHPDPLPSADPSSYWQRSMTNAKAVIYQISHPHSWRIIAPEIPSDIPILTFSTARLTDMHASARPPAYHLCLDMHAVISLATTHLLALGHRRIALITVGSNDEGSPSPSTQEVLGYQDALRCWGITEEIVIGIPGPLDDWEAQHDRVLHRALTSGGPLPTAFVCDADFRAVRLLAVLRELGLRCPQDCSVVGAWNTPWCNLSTPPLTSVSLAEEELARLMVLLSQQPVPATPTELTVTPRLIERGSTIAIRDHERKPI
jgi:hypothetical protein